MKPSIDDNSKTNTTKKKEGLFSFLRGHTSKKSSTHQEQNMFDDDDDDEIVVADNNGKKGRWMTKKI